MVLNGRLAALLTEVTELEVGEGEGLSDAVCWAFLGAVALVVVLSIFLR